MAQAGTPRMASLRDMRVIFLARKNDVIFVLDCFEKDSRKTEKHDIRRATARFKQVIQRLIEERKFAKHKQTK